MCCACSHHYLLEAYQLWFPMVEIRDKYLSAVYIFYMGTVLPNLGSRVEFLVARSATRKFEGKLKPESFVKPERKVFITGLAWDNSHNM